MLHGLFRKGTSVFIDDGLSCRQVGWQGMPFIPLTRQPRHDSGISVYPPSCQYSRTDVDAREILASELRILQRIDSSRFGDGRSERERVSEKARLMFVGGARRQEAGTEMGGALE